MNYCVVGAGAWGTAFAVHLARQGHATILAPRRAEHAKVLAAARENADYLPGIAFPENLQVAKNLGDALQSAPTILVACPAQSLRQTTERIKAAAKSDRGAIISLTKGLEIGTHARPSQVISQQLGAASIGTLTGPTHAGSIARGLPAAMVLASANPGSWLSGLQAAMSGPTLRISLPMTSPGRNTEVA